MAKKYFRILLGAKNAHAAECFQGDFIGVDFGIDQDLTNHLPEQWKDFNREFRPVYIQKYPDKTKVAAGLACGFLHTVSKGIKQGDIVLCPDGSGSYKAGEVVSDYYYQPGSILPHRRKVHWFSSDIERTAFSQSLKNSTGSIGTVCDITKYSEELEKLIEGRPSQTISVSDETVEDPTVFALEKHLEDFLVQNWGQTELGRRYDIFEEDGEIVGQQYPTDTGPIDILAISKDKKELLVVELKKGRASDSVLGQVQRYMGYVLEELAEENQKVSGVIVALEDDLKVRRALAVTSNIEFYRYQVSFNLFKA